MRTYPQIQTKIRPQISRKAKTTTDDNLLYQQAFDFSFHSNIVTTIRTGKIIMANNAACKLFGYSKKELSNKALSTIFDTNETSFKIMQKQRMVMGHSTAYVTVIKKSGKRVPCKVTSALFLDNKKIKKAIITIIDISDGLLKQSLIDVKKEEIVAKNIILAQAKCAAFLKKRLTEEHMLKVSQVAEAAEEARETERSDIGKELHDNINQLLGASNLYLGMAKREGKNRKMYLSRSSEYTLTAIEEIRKLTRRLTTDSLKDLGLSEAIKNMALTIMEINPVKITCALDSFTEPNMRDKFKLNIFRIVQEHLNNILKHARAKKVVIKLSQNKSSILLSISDNGIGFDTHKKRTGIGVNNITSRVKSYNGTTDFISKPGKGCILSITFPVQKNL